MTGNRRLPKMLPRMGMSRGTMPPTMPMDMAHEVQNRQRPVSTGKRRARQFKPPTPQTGTAAFVGRTR